MKQPRAQKLEKLRRRLFNRSEKDQGRHRYRYKRVNRKKMVNHRNVEMQNCEKAPEIMFISTYVITLKKNITVKNASDATKTKGQLQCKKNEIDKCGIFLK